MSLQLRRFYVSPKQLISHLRQINNAESNLPADAEVFRLDVNPYTYKLEVVVYSKEFPEVTDAVKWPIFDLRYRSRDRVYGEEARELRLKRVRLGLPVLQSRVKADRPVKANFPRDAVFTRIFIGQDDAGTWINFIVYSKEFPIISVTDDIPFFDLHYE